MKKFKHSWLDADVDEMKIEEIANWIREEAILLNFVFGGYAFKRKTKYGKKHLGYCPLCEAVPQSFIVEVDKQTYHCSACGAEGDIFALIMQKEKLDFQGAIDFLKDWFSAKAFSRAYDAKKTSKRMKACWQFWKAMRKIGPIDFSKIPEAIKGYSPYQPGV